MEDFIPWPEEFSKKYREARYWQDRTISEVLEERFKCYATRTALISDNGRKYTYADLSKLTTRLALHIHAMGLKLYDRVIL